VIAPEEKVPPAINQNCFKMSVTVDNKVTVSILKASSPYEKKSWLDSFKVAFEEYK
jgi:hypothetical protein